MGERVVEGITGQFTNPTMWFLIGGIAAIVGGAAMALSGGLHTTEVIDAISPSWFSETNRKPTR